MTFPFRPVDFDEMGITPPPGWNPSRRPHSHPQTAAQRQATRRRVQSSILYRIVHRCKALHAERCRLEKHLGASAADRVLQARSRTEVLAHLRSLLDEAPPSLPQTRLAHGTRPREN